MLLSELVLPVQKRAFQSQCVLRGKVINHQRPIDIFSKNVRVIYAETALSPDLTEEDGVKPGPHNREFQVQTQLTKAIYPSFPSVLVLQGDDATGDQATLYPDIGKTAYWDQWSIPHFEQMGLISAVATGSLGLQAPKAL
ncbi:hypothetical protein CB1_001681001 [Camelus ferus]|nr:hypothetical protein CB1_001681001 [Camelus ferus]